MIFCFLSRITQEAEKVELGASPKSAHVRNMVSVAFRQQHSMAHYSPSGKRSADKDVKRYVDESGI